MINQIRAEYLELKARFRNPEKKAIENLSEERKENQEVKES